ncbi:MAG TPA: hypothetical protein DIV86_07775, partial [Alphaproteobacteria bacterium]|nr:hypothetical protein [Alphaproteobacteria bacterium]
MKVRNYKDLVIWQKAVELAGDIFKITNNFPNSQNYVLV